MATKTNNCNNYSNSKNPNAASKYPLHDTSLDITSFFIQMISSIPDEEKKRLFALVPSSSKREKFALY